jgi:hypothetical protein
LKPQAPETSVYRLDMSSLGWVEEVMEFDCHLVDPLELGIRRGVEHPELGALDVDLHEVDPRRAAVKQGVKFESPNRGDPVVSQFAYRRWVPLGTEELDGPVALGDGRVLNIEVGGRSQPLERLRRGFDADDLATVTLNQRKGELTRVQAQIDDRAVWREVVCEERVPC